MGSLRRSPREFRVNGNPPSQKNDARNSGTRVSSQNRGDQGQRPDTKPKWPPPSVSSNVTLSETSHGRGIRRAGTSGSLCAFTMSVGTLTWLNSTSDRVLA